MLDIGTVVQGYWEDKADPFKIRKEPVTVMGYVYYKSRLYYVCLAEDGTEIEQGADGCRVI